MSLTTPPSTKLPPLAPIGSTLRWSHVLALPVYNKLNASTSPSCLGKTNVSPKYKVALFPNPTVAILRPTRYVPVLILITDVTLGGAFTSAPFIPTSANIPPP